MFIIFKNKDNETCAVNDKFIENISKNEYTKEYRIETEENYWEITEDQFINIINTINKTNDFHPCLDCRIFVNKL